MSKVRRSVANFSEGGRAHINVLQTVLLKITNVEERILSMEKKQKEQVVRDAQKKFDINPYFPAASMTILNDFMSNKDGNFKEKKDEFEVYLNSIGTLDNDMDTFSAGLLKVLFTKEFIRDHRFPTSE